GRLALRQAALLSALVAGTPVPEGFDGQRVRVQAEALLAKRASVVRKVAPELPEILGGPAYRAAFRAYARSRPLTGGYRRDALDFAEHLLIQGLPDDPKARRRLTTWWQDRAGARPRGLGARLLDRLRGFAPGRPERSRDGAAGDGAVHGAGTPAGAYAGAGGGAVAGAVAGGRSTA
ncbi:hypothetical protein LG632_29670, partial [Streptomyces sp. SMC 277]|nr:hypothetical protein [Streptomyces antimicrobicus]